jgi:hypothetical protein
MPFNLQEPTEFIPLGSADGGGSTTTTATTGGRNNKKDKSGSKNFKFR